MLADLIERLRSALGHQADCRADLARSAIAALESIVLDEGLLQRVQHAPLRQSFDGAGAALAVVAALLGPGEVEMQTQRVEQRGPRRDAQPVIDAIDVKGDSPFFRSR
jgi:hypothetical protein